MGSSSPKHHLPANRSPCLIPPANAEMTKSKANHSGRTKKPQTLIYVVDDEPMLLELASVILEPLGYEVKTFRDGESAAEAFASAKPRPDLIITDFAMHAMN